MAIAKNGGNIIMKKCLAIIFDIILCLAAVTFVVCIWMKPVCTDLVKDAYVEKSVKSKVLDVVNKVATNVSDDDMSKIEDAVSDSKVLDDITAKYLDSIAGAGELAVTQTEINQYVDELTNENMNIIEEKTGYAITENEKNALKNEMNSKSSQILENLNNGVEQVTSQMTPKQKSILKLYSVLNSNILHFGLIILMIVLAVAIILLRWRKTKWLLNIGLSAICAGAITGGFLPMCVIALSYKITNRILGSSMDIPVDILYLYGGVMAIGGIVLTILYFTMGKVSGKQKR